LIAVACACGRRATSETDGTIQDVEKRLLQLNSSVKDQSVPAILLMVVLAGCTQQRSSQDLKEKTAQATAEAKRDAKAVAAGIREGWNRDKPLNLNTATKDELLALPGMTSTVADQVVAARPYRDPEELVTRHILSKTEYDKISDRVAAK
jgi:DNA uptake protein ComE-like DNA-binding protein